LNKIVFVTGGARSGKSDFTQKYAESMEGYRLYIATAIPFDDEMAERIKKHKEKRENLWHGLIEEPYNLHKSVLRLNPEPNVVLIDCITLWLNNLLLKYENNVKKIYNCIDELSDNIRQVRYNLFIVSNEVGMGIVPENRLSRLFRDISGYANQKIASVSNEFYVTFSGYNLRLK